MPGIGKKTAERLLLELKGKLGADIGAHVSVSSDAQLDILQALVALGYSDKDAALALKALPHGRGRERRHQAGVEGAGEIKRPNA